MHQKYGPVVRMAPNYLDLDYDTCASLIRTCFDTKGVWRKTEWHAVSGFQVGKETRYNIFSEVRPLEHSLMKKPVAKYWTSSAVARMEPHIDSVIAFFAKQLQDRFTDGGEGDMGTTFNFGEWAMFCELCYRSDMSPAAVISRLISVISRMGCSRQNNDEQANRISGSRIRL